MALPASALDLPFCDGAFDIALSSHFLFLHTDNLSYGFHVDAIREMLRVSGEVRIFPLLDYNANRSPYVERILVDFAEQRTAIRRVDYEFHIGGNEMLMIENMRAMPNRSGGT